MEEKDRRETFRSRQDEEKENVFLPADINFNGNEINLGDMKLMNTVAKRDIRCREKKAFDNTEKA